MDFITKIPHITTGKKICLKTAIKKDNILFQQPLLKIFDNSILEQYLKDIFI